MPNWTKQQLDAIEDRGHSLIVCAAAGSGKTAVLVERIVQLVKEGCPIEQMLVVTFTNAAAGEMRLRIGAALTEAARERPELGEQARAVSRASISTLHRFCGNLLRTHFEALGLDPSFRIGDEQECGVLARQAMEDALYACYETGSEAFAAADACYDEEDLAQMAQGVYRFMMTRPDPQAFLARALALCAGERDALAGGEAVRLLLEGAQQDLARLRADAEHTLSLCGGEGGPAHYAPACAQDVGMIDDLIRAAQAGYDALKAALDAVRFAALGRKKKGDLYDEETAEDVKRRRDALKKALGALREQFAPTLEEAAADLALTRKPLEGLFELTRTYEMLYSAAKSRRGVLDFDDLEHGALRALEKEEVREALAARYRYVFIDEYQDSSAIQEAIIGSFAPKDGLFLVGDVKQSIYRFRQAEPAIFLARAAEFDRADDPMTKRIDLQNNFRSRANVLHGVNAVFERIMRADATEIEYDARERLVPGLEMRQDDPPLELHIVYRQDAQQETEEDGEEEQALRSIEREAVIAARRIRELVGTPFYDAKSGGERPLAYRDMAVLLRVASGQAPLAADILKREGVPVFCDAGSGYFDIPEIRSVMALLQTIANGAQDEALLGALRGPALGLEESELAAVRIHTPDTRVPYYEAVRRYREEMDDALAAKLSAFEERLSRWRLCARHQGVDRLIERIYSETGFVAAAGALPGGAARQANLSLLVTRARSFMRAQGGSLSAFLRYAERLRAGGDAMSASAIGESEDVVRIMTTHKSKGLEFPVVFMLGMGRSMRAQTKKDRLLMHADLGVALPCVDTQMHSERETILRRAIRLITAREQLAEEIRILYVGMTRARERLILIGDISADEPPERWRGGETAADVLAMKTGLDMICPALTHAGACLTIPQEQVTAGLSRWHVFAHTGGAAQAQTRRSEEAVASLLAELQKETADEDTLRLLAFVPGAQKPAVRKTTVSAVVRDEKRAAQEETYAPAEIMRLPRFMQEKQMTGAAIGTAFHRMMRMIDLARLKETKDLQKEIARQLDAMLESGVINAAEYAAVPARMLVSFFASPLGVRLLLSERVEREWAFTFRMADGAGGAQLVQGVIDCCFIERGKWVLLDYKTDSAKDAQGAIARHRPQLALYAQALEQVTKTPVAERVLYLVRAGAGYPV